MARIYKESRYVLQLLIGKSYGAQYDDVKISFYTKNPSNQVMADDDITIKGNVAQVMVDSTLFDNLEDGLISYIVYGTKDGIPFIEERQSNYFLKTPLDFKPTTCILEDKSVTPSMGDRNDDGYIIIEKSEGYDGLSRVVINPQTIYNEGLEAGRAEGGGGGSCNLGVLDWTLTEPNGQQKNASDDGYDGYSQVIVRPENVIAQEKENAINDFKNNMSEIAITENGTYSIDDTELTHSIAFDGNSYFDTGIVPTENIKIEVCIKVTNGNNSQMGGIIIGGGIDSVNNDTENRGIAIGMDRGAIYGKWGAIKSWNNPYDYVRTTTVVLQKTDDSWRWDTEKGSFSASTLYIGGYNRNGEEVEEKFTQSIVYIKIWTDRNDDSTMTLFRPKNMAQGGFGLVNSGGTEYNYVENIGTGTTTFVEEWVKKYPNGFKRVEVNVPNTLENIQTRPISIDDYNALIGNYDPNVLYLIY